MFPCNREKRNYVDLKIQRGISFCEVCKTALRKISNIVQNTCMQLIDRKQKNEGRCQYPDLQLLAERFRYSPRPFSKNNSHWLQEYGGLNSEYRGMRMDNLSTIRGAKQIHVQTSHTQPELFHTAIKPNVQFIKVKNVS